MLKRQARDLEVRGSNPGSDSNPGSGSNPGTGSSPDPDSSFLLKSKTAIFEGINYKIVSTYQFDLCTNVTLCLWTWWSPLQDAQV